MRCPLNALKFRVSALRHNRRFGHAKYKRVRRTVPGMYRPAQALNTSFLPIAANLPCRRLGSVKRTQLPVAPSDSRGHLSRLDIPTGFGVYRKVELLALHRLPRFTQCLPPDHRHPPQARTHGYSNLRVNNIYIYLAHPSTPRPLLDDLPLAEKPHASARTNHPPVPALPSS